MTTTPMNLAARKLAPRYFKPEVRKPDPVSAPVHRDPHTNAPYRYVRHPHSGNYVREYLAAA